MLSAYKKNIYIVLPILGTIGLLIFIFLSDKHKETNRPPAKEITPQEINAKECKSYIDSIFDGLPDLPKMKSFTREDAVLSCTNEMNSNYKNGLPNYATHTPKEMHSYNKTKIEKNMARLRTMSNDEVKEIYKLCAKPIYIIYSNLYGNKSKGKSKEEQVKSLRTTLHGVESSSILNTILMGLSYEMLDEIYSKSGPTTGNEAAEQIVVFHKKCTDAYETAMLLR